MEKCCLTIDNSWEKSEVKDKNRNLVGFGNAVRIGLGTEFRSEKIPRNRLGMVSVIPRKKALIPRHSEFRGRANSEARNGTEWNRIPRKKFVLQKGSKIN